MDMTIIWMIATILVMVFLLILSAVWSELGKKRRRLSENTKTDTDE